LKPGGVVRISTPDLELQARSYLESLTTVLRESNDLEERRYELGVVSLIDQLVRSRGGGELIDYFRGTNRDLAYARGLYGAVVDEFLPPEERQILPTLQSGRRASLRLNLLNPRQLWDRLRFRWLSRLSKNPTWTIGENELWRWDRHSLQLMLTTSGFDQFAVVSPNSSRLPVWQERALDVLPGPGEPIEVSLYVEARKPG
jgi:hypothetical protein